MEVNLDPRTGWAAAARLPQLDALLVRVSKQAAKLGVAPLTYKRTGRTEERLVRQRVDALGQSIRETALFVEITVQGEVPKLPGDWTLLAVVNHEEGLPIVKCVPGNELPKGQRDRGALCDHCNKSRSRKDTFVLRAVDGRVVQVGRNCLADFLGVSNFKPEALLALVTFLRDPLAGLDAFEFGDDAYGQRAHLMLDVRSVVVASGACIDEEGWVSRGKAMACATGTATADSVSFLMHPPLDPTYQDVARIERYRARMNAALQAEADAAIAWAVAQLGTSDDYLNNLAVCATRGTVGTDNFGIVVSLIASYRRTQAQLRVREQKRHNMGYVGTVGERTVLTLALVAPPKAIESYYGTSYRCEFTDAEGHLLVWWASNDPGQGGREGGWAVGEVRKVKATIKKHEEYRGILQTIVTRVADAK